MEYSPLLPLPLHPRRAQQLFQDILLIDAQSTPELSCLALPQRLNQLQSFNLSGIQEAKRGTKFQLIRTRTDSSPQVETEVVTLRLDKNGSMLIIAPEGDCSAAVSIRLLDLQAIIVHTSPTHSFSFNWIEECDNDNNGEVNTVAKVSDIFVSTSADVLNRWIIALTCGINAFQQQQQQTAPQTPGIKSAQLVWQAARLRIFELAEIMPLPAAIAQVSQSIPDQDRQCPNLRSCLHLLHCV